MRISKVGAVAAIAAGVALGLTGTAGAAEKEYVGHTQCKVCHNVAEKGEQWTKWQGEKHAKAFETLKSEAAQAIAKEKGLTVPAHEAPECLKCHVTGYDAETKKLPAKIKMEDSVQCESCHGPNSLHVKDAMVLKMKPDQAATIDIKANLKEVNADTCTQCHNPESPTWDPERFTTASGEKAGFDFDAAWKEIDHSNPQKEDKDP